MFSKPHLLFLPIAALLNLGMPVRAWSQLNSGSQNVTTTVSESNGVRFEVRASFWNGSSSVDGCLVNGTGEYLFVQESTAQAELGFTKITDSGDSFENSRTRYFNLPPTFLAPGSEACRNRSNGSDNRQFHSLNNASGSVGQVLRCRFGQPDSGFIRLPLDKDTVVFDNGRLRITARARRVRDPLHLSLFSFPVDLTYENLTSEPLGWDNTQVTLAYMGVWFDETVQLPKRIKKKPAKVTIGTQADFNFKDPEIWLQP